MLGQIVVRVDMTEPGRGLILVTGGHGFPESPQAQLGRNGRRWYVEDAYGDLNRDGETTRQDYFNSTAPTIREAVVRWLDHLGIEPDADHVHIGEPEREY